MITLDMSRETVNRTLAEFLSAQKASSHAIHPSYGRLYEEIERVVFAGGKRLRPHLLFMGYGSYDESIAKVAAAHELLHVALLVHDDIIDRDIIRHGQATIHQKYDIAHYAPFIDSPIDRHHFSTSAALLAGDLLIASAYELIRQANLDAEKTQAAIRLIGTGIFEVAGGELLDTEAPFIPEAYDPMLVYRYKTTGYSFISPLLSGATLSGSVSSEDLDRLRSCATNLGIAYQIKDDYLGVFGESAKSGKSTVSDLREGKQTILVTEFAKRASLAQLALFERTFGKKDASEDELSELREAFKASGALDEAARLGDEFTQLAINAVVELSDVTLQKNLHDLVQLLNERLS